MTKKTVLIILCTILFMCLVGCGKSESAKLVDDKINSIGTVTLDSESLIIDAENEYAKLADKEKEEVEYYQTLVDARMRFDELLKEENNKKEEIKKEIQVLIDDNKIKDAREKIDEIDDSYTDIKNELITEISDKCYEGIELVKFLEVVSNQPDSSKEKVDDGDRIGNYYYYSMYSDLDEAFNDYYSYLNENTTKTGSDDFLYKLYNFSLDDKEVTIILFDEKVNGRYMIQISYDK